jgi:hypothetical protein
VGVRNPTIIEQQQQKEQNKTKKQFKKTTRLRNSRISVFGLSS